MSFFDSIGRLAGKVIMAPFTIVNGAIDAAVEALEDLTDDK